MLDNSKESNEHEREQKSITDEKMQITQYKSAIRNADTTTTVSGVPTARGEESGY
jgi:hypothetical protein